MSLYKEGHGQGKPKTREYSAWCNMKARCNNPTHPQYPYYGARGIKVCGEWQNSFVAFFAYMGPKPSPEYSLDRFPDNNGDYRPGNCRWATDQQQHLNTRRTRLTLEDQSAIIHSGEKPEVLAKLYGVTGQRIRHLLRHHTGA